MMNYIVKSFILSCMFLKTYSNIVISKSDNYIDIRIGRLFLNLMFVCARQIVFWLKIQH